MHDNSPTSDEIVEIVSALKDEYSNRDEQFDNHIYELVDNIPFLSLWDVCIVFARYMVFGGSIPDCIKVKDLNLLIEAIEDASDQVPALLNPIQQWLSEQLIKSIDKKEIKAKIVGRLLDGKLDAKRTYIDNGQIYEWLTCRNIAIDDVDENFYFDNSSLFERVHNEIFGASKLLVARAYNPCFEIPTIDSSETYHLVIENARLKAQIDQTSSHHSTYKKAHGNSERFAKNREQVLGAALSVITQWPDQCQNSSGKFEATKIAKLIDEKSLLYWPTTSEPPLSLDKMEREISKWINGGTVK